MKKTMFLNRIITTLILFILLSLSTGASNSPNIVFILVDDLGWADVKCNFPESFYDTPHIDQLAQKGLRFTQAYAANPVCSPTRAALMTGKHPNRLNITDWIPGQDPKNRPLLGPKDQNHLDLSEITLAEQLKKKGYKTCFIGKWHLGDQGFFPENQGFDINIGGHDKGSPPGGYYSPYKNPILTDGPEGEYLPDRLTNEGIKFIKENKASPFFLYLAYYTVHTPIQASKKYIEKYKRRSQKLKSPASAYQKEGDGWTRTEQGSAPFGSMVEAMDENVGRILSMLKEQGLDNNTWVIFTSDNGGLSTLYYQGAPTSNGHLRAGKGWCYEGGIRIPLIISGPGVHETGRVTDVPVVSMDHYTTLLHIAGVEHNDFDGVNLLPLLEGDESLSRDELFWHYPHYHGSAWKPGSALRKGDWKIILHYENDKTELYNLKTDPEEKTDLSTTYPDKVSSLKALLYEKLTQTHAAFPVPNENYEAESR